ncbi:MAG: AAA family ATPase [Candidatus Lokiarchaeota archaeon]|nr:AAA family ATPase [Candidatus Lokiarchaeota archaeon]
MMIEETILFISELASNYGAKIDDEYLKSYIFRKNTKEDAFKKGGAYFGFISPEEEATGPYHDFSLVIFPDHENKSWIISLGVGSLGFKNDYELASLPGIRRLFSSIISQNGFCKTSFLDIETSLPAQFTSNIPHLKESLKIYSKVLPVCEIIPNPMSPDGKRIITGFVAAYAEMRKWASNANQRKAINKAIEEISNKKELNEEDEINEVLSLVEKRKFIILQGAPGTGKTRLAKIIGTKLEAEVFFTQFHAETNYSDFIYGSKPNLKEGQVGYIEQKGIFYQSLKKAVESEKNVVLIIDEINRANLSNILGPIFYLFEYKLGNDSVEIDIGGGYKINKVPSNFYVIGTMNTADRSLAVVDFALRRRFAWYTMKPKVIPNIFSKEDFLEFDKIFKWYANSEELSLQPGHGYFIADSEDEMKSRIRYELMPLIKEYFAEGLLLSAKEDFSKYFYDRLGEDIFE